MRRVNLRLEMEKGDQQNKRTAVLLSARMIPKAYPQFMSSSLSGVLVQSFAIRVTRETVHNREADRAGFVALKTQVIMSACHRMIMLVDHKMVSIRLQVAPVDIKPVIVS